MPAFRPVAAALIAIALAQASALAQEPQPDPAPAPAAAQEQEAPSVMSDVARLGFVEGEVSVTDGGSGEWAAGQVNAPLVGGDELATGPGARAELQLDSQNVIRLDGDTQMRLAAFTREQVALEIARGRIAYALGTAPVIPVQLAGPVVTFQPREAGFYIFAVAPDGTTRVTVRRGIGAVVRGDEQRAVARGQTAVIAPGESGEIRIEQAVFPDAWETWVIQREDQARGAQSWSKLNNNYVGAQDLDRHGEWRETPEYGRVWIPGNVEPGWAPYREGYWTWKPYWGWVWVSNEPWGWTPYHYGRWVMIDGGWAWWPGPVTVHYVPVWAPAYVAFFDFHHRDRYPGHVAWLPLGPADWCHPWWSRHNGPRPGGPGPARVDASLLAGKFGRADHGPAIRPLVPPGKRNFSVLASAAQDPRVRNAASNLPADKFGQRQRRSESTRLDDASFRRGSMMVGAAPAMPAQAPAPRNFTRPDRNFGPRPAAVGIERPQPGVDKPMTRPQWQPSAVTPQKVPTAPDATPRRDWNDGNPRREAPKPFAPPNASAAPATTILRPQSTPTPQAPQPQQHMREFRRDAPVTPSAVPQAPQPQMREFRRDAPAMPSAAPMPQVVRPVEPPRPVHVEPVRPPQAVRPPEPARPMHAEPPRPPAPQMQRPSAPAHVERPSPPPQQQQRSAPPPQRQEAPRNQPQRNCGPKPCT